jgi:hypothetical protein
MPGVKILLRQCLSRLVNPLLNLFKCQHARMSPPFTRESETYCTCMTCGARRQFNVERGKMAGSFYYPTPAALYSPLSRNNSDSENDKYGKS